MRLTIAAAALMGLTALTPAFAAEVECKQPEASWKPVEELKTKLTAEGWTIVADAEPIWIHALSGMLRAMADDYGVLAVIEVAGDQLQVSVPLTAFSEGRPFSISDPLLGVA